MRNFISHCRVTWPRHLAATVILCALSARSGTGPQFDAASVRVNESAERPFTKYDPTRVELHKASVKHLVRRAWPLPDYRIVWPAWVDAQRGSRGYDVSVTFPRDTTPESLNLMFQDLLATRFGLAVHQETRDAKVFEVRAGGTATGSTAGGLRSAQNPAPPTDFPKYTTKLEGGLWHLSSQLGGAASGLTVAGLLEALDATHILDHPLVDATGLEGTFDIELSVPADPPDNRPNAGELLKALERQTGLRATLRTLPLKMLVIDRMERIPTAN